MVRIRARGVRNSWEASAVNCVIRLKDASNRPSILLSVSDIRPDAGSTVGLLYGRADRAFYTRQIAREVDASLGAVQRELENLSRVGLIVRKSVGSQVFYQANRNAPVFREMQALVNKTVGIFSILQAALHPLSKQIVLAFVYGSVAREEETTQSDVDLMVVGKATLDEVLSRLSPVEFESKIAGGKHFLNAVVKGQKVFLVGDDDELGKVGGVRMAGEMPV